MEKSFNELTKNERIKYRKELIAEGKSVCSGPLCQGKVKPLAEFCKHRLSTCVECNRHNNRESLKKNDRADRREKNRLKMDKVCEVCGEDDIELLEFDHIEVNDKSFTISSMQSAKKIFEEVSKTRILCIWCHRLRTQKYIEENLKKTKEDYEYGDEEEIGEDEGKVCKGELCKGKVRKLENFYLSKNKYSKRCKKCHTYKGMLNRRVNKEFINDLKLKMGKCQECKKVITKETLCCFDLDHLNQETKTIEISKLGSSQTIDREFVKEEIKKCQLLCCKCHKKKTCKQLKYHQRDKEGLKQYDHIQYKKEKDPPSICPKCNKNEKEKKAECCIKCWRISCRTVERPSFETLEDEVAKDGYVKTGKKYGVSDKSIKKWIIWYVKEEGKQVTKIKI